MYLVLNCPRNVLVSWLFTTVREVKDEYLFSTELSYKCSGVLVVHYSERGVCIWF